MAVKLKDCLELLSADNNLDAVVLCITYANGITCYDDSFDDHNKIIKNLPQEDLKKVVKNIIFSCNHITKMNYVTIELGE